jgi:subtilisin family serine protease
MIGASTLGVVPNRIYVTYRSAARAKSAVAPKNLLRNTTLAHNGGVQHVLAFASAADAQNAMHALKADPNVTSVDPVHTRRLASDSVANDALVNNVDTWYNYRTHVDTGTAATSAWGIAPTSPVKIAIIDTGIDETNTDINSKTTFKESVITNGSGQQVVTTGNGSVQDTDGHGTNVAGLAIAQVNNESDPATGFDSTAFAGVAGVGNDISLLSFKIFPDSTASCEDPSADTSDEATAIDDAVAQGASVISMSLGGPQSGGADAGEEAAVEAAINAGVVVIAAAGNEYPSSDGNSVDYPAAYPGVIAVGASAVTDSTANSYASITADTVASYSNSGATLVAPGGDAPDNNDPDILHWIEGYDTSTGGAADLQCETGYPSSTEQVCAVLFNGTSQATPQVSGTVALMESVHGGSKSITPTAAKTYLTSTAAAIPGISSTRQGAGLLNAYAAVTAAHL